MARRLQPFRERMNPKKSKVLLVDDDPSMLRLVSRWLETSGYGVRCAENGKEALAAIEAECPDFLITDWDMPEMDGLELCRRVRKLDLPHYLYILFLTVKSDSSETIEGLEIGADDFLHKPVHQGELLARMRSASRVLTLERRLSQLARTDPLTGLTSRRTFHEELDKEWKRAERLHLPLCCVMLDIDFFKRVNDNHGHQTGDAVLRAVAELLSDVSRGSDTVCRYGGEEFCVMLPETSETDAAAWAERARRRLSEVTIPVGNTTFRITGSFGVAQRYDDTQTPAALIDLADQALLCAKRSGRDRVVRYESLSAFNDVDLTLADKKNGLFHGVAARHVMTPLVVCLRQEETVGNATEFFLRSRINSTPVVDQDGKLAGFLSEKDLMAAMVSLDCWQQPIREIMKPNVIRYEEDTPIRLIYEFLCRVTIRRVVIVRDGRPSGTISRGTLLRWFRNTVLSKGLMGPQESPQAAGDADPHRSRERLAETTRELARQASDLHKRFMDDTDDLVPYVVGGATCMQDLVNDLLAYSRYADPNVASAGAMQSMLLESSHID